MTRTDHRIILTALGFLAVILKDDSADNQASRAMGIAKLIEDFCRTALPDVVPNEFEVRLAPMSEIEELVQDYIADLHVWGAAELPEDRQKLLQMYELLITQKMRHEQSAFYLLGNNTEIANLIMQLAYEQMQREG